MLSRQRKKILTGNLALAFFFILGCGVKGDPIPPTKPPELGRGQPTYRKATEKIQLQKYTPVEDREKDEKDSEDE
jgi:hypothetical protein